MSDFPPDLARSVAIRAHEGKKYGGRPYVFHLDQVADLCTSYGEIAQTVAYLHDTLEDTSLPAEEIEKTFGLVVRACVEAVTDPPGENRRIRKAAVYARLDKIDVRTDLKWALVVKAADRLANVRMCVRDYNPGVFKMYQEEHFKFSLAVHRSGLNSEFMKELDYWLEEWGGHG